MDQRELAELYNRGLTHNADQNFTEALSCFDKVLAENSTDMDAIYSRACALNGLKRYRDAARGFEAALRLKPDDIDSLYGLALALSEAGQDDAAAASFRKLVSLASRIGDPSGYSQYAQEWLEELDHERTRKARESEEAARKAKAQREKDVASATAATRSVIDRPKPVPPPITPPPTAEPDYSDVLKEYNQAIGEGGRPDAFVNRHNAIYVGIREVAGDVVVDRKRPGGLVLVVRGDRCLLLPHPRADRFHQYEINACFDTREVESVGDDQQFVRGVQEPAICVLRDDQWVVKTKGRADIERA